jgi:hypothetical protein
MTNVFFDPYIQLLHEGGTPISGAPNHHPYDRQAAAARHRARAEAEWGETLEKVRNAADL